MKLTAKQKILIVSGIILAFISLTNPDRNDFINFLGYPKVISDAMTIRKEKNYIICSVFSENFKKKRYLGICGNFYELNSLGNDTKEK